MRRRGRSILGTSITLVVAAAVLLALVLLFDRLSRKPLTKEQAIRATVADYLEACRDRDYGDVFDLMATGSRSEIGPGPGGDDRALFVARAAKTAPTGIPGDPSDWYLWHLPVGALDRLIVRGISTSPDRPETGVLVELVPDGDRRIGTRTCRMEISLVLEDEEWRVETVAMDLEEDLPAPPPPLAEEKGETEDGRACLFLGYRGEPLTVPAEVPPVLILRVGWETAFREITGALRGAVEAGCEEVRIRPERREAGTRGTWVLFTGLRCLKVVSGVEDPPEMVVPVPERPKVVDLVVGVGPRVAPVGSRRGEAIRFRTSLSAESSRALIRFAELCGKPNGRIDAIVSCHLRTDMDRLARVWSDLRERGYRSLILAEENPLGAGYASALLINGLRPEQVMQADRESVPQVWPDNPVLQRTFAR
jgi:hypothetical protein